MITTALAALAGFAGIAGLIGSLLGLIPPPWGAVTRWTGFLALAFILGFRAADDRAARALLRAEIAHLEAQLKHHRMIGAVASAERDRLRAEKQDSDRRISDYEAFIATQEPVAACSIDDDDLRFRDSLRHSAR